MAPENKNHALCPNCWAVLETRFEKNNSEDFICERCDKMFYESEVIYDEQ